jgi:hypothetical protein
MPGAKGRSGGRRPGQGRPRRFTYHVEVGGVSYPFLSYANAWAALKRWYEQGDRNIRLVIEPIRSNGDDNIER